MNDSQNFSWLTFALMTVGCWGVYGILLHKGVVAMAGDPNGRFKAFLFVGIAYFLTAVLAPVAILALRGASWNFSTGLMGWSLVAGIAGAVGAFCVLLAFGAKGSPTAVMSIIFAGAPCVNALVLIIMQNTWGDLRWQFVLGVLMAALGGCLVTIYKPAPKPHGQPTAVSIPAELPAAMKES
jgi:hypothetical protein